MNVDKKIIIEKIKTLSRYVYNNYPDDLELREVVLAVEDCIADYLIMIKTNEVLWR